MGANGGQTGGQEADERRGGRGAKERQTGGRGADGRTSGRHRVWRRMGGRANRQIRADEVRTGRPSGWAEGRMSRGYKRPRTSFPASLSSAQTTRFTAERVCRALGSALGSQPGLCYFFFCSEQHICNSSTKLL